MSVLILLVLVLGVVLLLRKLCSTVLKPPSIPTTGAGLLRAAAVRGRFLTVS